MNQIEIIRTEKKVEERTYKLGQIFLTTENELYMLARVGNDDIVLVGIEDGNRWRTPVTIKDSLVITYQDMLQCAEDLDSFTPVDTKITVTL